MTEILPLHRMLNAEPATEASRDLAQIMTEVGTNTLLFLLIFGMAGTVDIRNLKKQLHNRYAILTGVCMQFVVMPFLGYLAVLSLKPFGLTTSMGITLLIVTASPGGSYSNWWCSLFNADLALSVAMTALSTMLSIGLLPANLLLYAHAAYGFSSGEEQHVLKSVDFFALMISLVIVISAILTGLYASYKSESIRFRKAANALGSFAGLALVVLSAVLSTHGTGDDGVKPWDQHWSFYIGVSAPCVVGLILANVLAKFANLEYPEIVTLSVECCYQNVGIATSAVLAMFQDKDEIARAMAIPLYYGLVEAGLLGLYCLVAWKLGWTKAPRDEQICVVLTKTYEVEDVDEEEDENTVNEGGDVEAQKEKDCDVDSRTLSIAPTTSTLYSGSSKPDESEMEQSIPITPSSSQDRPQTATTIDGRSPPKRNNSLNDLSYDDTLSRGGISSSFSFEESFRTIESVVSKWDFLPFRRNASADDPSPYQMPERISRSEEYSPRDISYMYSKSMDDGDEDGRDRYSSSEASRDRIDSDVSSSEASRDRVGSDITD